MAESPWKDIGPAEISWGGVVIGKTGSNAGGGTHGGTRWRTSISTAESFRDATGTQKHDSIVTGTQVEVEANFVGLNVDQLAELIPGAYTQNMGGGAKKLVMKSAVGSSLRALSKQLILKPLDAGVATTDEDQWVVFPLAHPKPNFDIVFDLQTQKVTTVMFDVFTNLTTDVIASVGQQAT